jgi:hypothetical protein
MATDSGKKGKSRKRALEVLDKLPDGGTVVLPQDENGDIKGESLAEILAGEAEVKKPTLNPVVLLSGIAGILNGTITSGEEVLKLAEEAVVDEKAPVEEIKPEETAGDAAQEPTETTSDLDPVSQVIEESAPPADPAPQDAPPTAGGKTVEDIMAELGLNIISDAANSAIPEIKLPERREQAPSTPKEPKAGKTPKEPKAPKAAAAPSTKIPIDAPIPAAEFRGHMIGVYGNLLEKLEAPDANGYEYSEIKLERYNATAHESFRKTNGRMVMLYPQGGGVYLVVAELPDGTREPVIEVTNSGRGRFRCRQIATAFRFAYIEKKDEVMIKPDEYAALKAQVKAIPVAPVTPPAPAQEPPKEEPPQAADPAEEPKKEEEVSV